MTSLTEKKKCLSIYRSIVVMSSILTTVKRISTAELSKDKCVRINKNDNDTRMTMTHTVH